MRATPVVREHGFVLRVYVLVRGRLNACDSFRFEPTALICACTVAALGCACTVAALSCACTGAA